MLEDTPQNDDIPMRRQKVEMSLRYDDFLHNDKAWSLWGCLNVWTLCAFVTFLKIHEKIPYSIILA